MQLIGLKFACGVAGLGEEVGAQPSYMQMAPPPVHPGAPVTDRGFTGPGGAAGGARRRLAGKLFERQHSLQDPSFDPVSQRFGTDEVSISSTCLLVSIHGFTWSHRLSCRHLYFPFACNQSVVQPSAVLWVTVLVPQLYQAVLFCTHVLSGCRAMEWTYQLTSQPTCQAATWLAEAPLALAVSR